MCQILTLLDEAHNHTLSANKTVFAYLRGEDGLDLGHADAEFNKALQIYEEILCLDKAARQWSISSANLHSEHTHTPLPSTKNQIHMWPSDWVCHSEALVGSIAMVVDHYTCSLYLGRVKECAMAPYFWHTRFSPFRLGGWIYLADWVRIYIDVGDVREADRIARCIVRYGPTDGSYVDRDKTTPNVRPISSPHIDATILSEEAVIAYGLWTPITESDAASVNSGNESVAKELCVLGQRIIPEISRYVPLISKFVH